MKTARVATLILAALLLAVPVTAQESSSILATHYQPGNVAFSLGAGAGFGGGFGATLYPGAEIIVAKVRPAGLFSLDFGLGAKGALSVWRSSFSDVGYYSIGVTPLVSAHLGLRGFAGSELAEYLDRIDLFTSFGLGYQLVVPTGTTAGDATGGLAFANFSGVNYFLTDSIALTVSSNYLSSGSTLGAFSAGIGVVFKIGPAEELGERVSLSIPDLSRLTGEAMYINFASLYWASVSLGGYLPNDETFDVGDGIRFRHRYRSADGQETDEIEFTRALLSQDGDGSRWWRYEFVIDEETLGFEARVNADSEITLMRYLDPGTDEVITYEPEDGDLWRSFEEGDFLTAEELDELRTGTERITVPAGTFRTERIETSEDEYAFTWWLSDEVPGRVVRFQGTSDEAEGTDGELLEVLRGVTSPWGAP